MWSKDWAKTDKQKQRYEQYQGDEMYFFFGRIKEFRQQAKQEDSWREEKLMQLDKAINILEKIPDNNKIATYPTIKPFTILYLVLKKDTMAKTTKNM